jgi:hypothetical protein
LILGSLYLLQALLELAGARLYLALELVGEALQAVEAVCVL